MIAARQIFLGRGGGGAKTLYRWIRMHVSRVRLTAGQAQWSEIQMLDVNDNVYQWPEGTTCYNTTNHVNVGTFGTGQTLDKLIDGSLDTKMCAINLGSYKYFDFDVYIDLGAEVFDAKKWCKWRWYTADDNHGRDPVAFSLYLSTDANTWVPVDADAEVNITTTRKALAYTGNIDLKMDYVKTGLVAWWDGIWNAGVGEHDSAANEWVDLTDGTAYELLDTGSWDDDSRLHTAGVCFRVDKTAQLLEAVKTGIFSFEVGTSKALGDATWVSQIVNIAPSTTIGYNIGIIELARDESTGQVNTSYGGTGSYSADGIYIPSDKDAFITSAVVLDGAKGCVYANGSGLYSNGSAITPNGSLEGVYLRLPATSYSFRGHYHFFRFYNRVLSSKEIAVNEAIDRTRFTP